jgi:CRP-like cAMP-binding protein
MTATLERCALFAGLGPDVCAKTAQRCRARRFDKGERIFSMGDPGEGLFVVAQGSIAIASSTADGDEVVLAVLGPGSSFGELAVIDGGPRVASASAREKTVLVYVPGSVVRDLMEHHPAVATTMLRALAVMVRRLDHHAVDLVHLDLPDRVAKYLLAMAQEQGSTPGSDGVLPVRVAMSQTELARIVGGSRQNVNRAIVALESAGAIVRSGPRIVGVRLDLLADRASG